MHTDRNRGNILSASGGRQKLLVAAFNRHLGLTKLIVSWNFFLSYFNSLQFARMIFLSDSTVCLESAGRMENIFLSSKHLSFAPEKKKKKVTEIISKKAIREISLCRLLVGQ